MTNPVLQKEVIQLGKEDFHGIVEQFLVMIYGLKLGGDAFKMVF